jgi:Beta-propeller repeat
MKKTITFGRSLVAALLCLSMARPAVPQRVPTVIPQDGRRMPLRTVKMSTDALAQVRTRGAFPPVPSFFIENRGQVDSGISYYMQGHYASVSFASQGVTFDLIQFAAEPDNEHIGKTLTLGQIDAERHHILTLEFVGANLGVQPVGNELLPTVVNYFSGPRDQWKTGLKTYKNLLYSDLWPGIQLIYSGTAEGLKYTFVVKPGADARQIQLAYQGATGMHVTELGDLEVSTPVRTLRDKRPYAYQEIHGKRVNVPVSFSLGSAGAPFGFDVGNYNKSQPLFIDPTLFFYASYFGTGGDDRGLGIAVDPEGSAFVTGQVPNGRFRGVDAYVAKVNAPGTGLLYLTFIGGTGLDAGFDIALDASGNAYVTGATSSTEASFPVLGGPDLTHNGGYDAFVAKLDPTGNLVFAGYIGGAGTDFGEGIAVDRLGNVYVTGPTDSSEDTFPATVGPDVTYNGNFDVFVAKLKVDPTDAIPKNNFEYCGYIGGAGVDIGLEPGGRSLTAGQIAVDASGSAYVSGMTTSTEATFPVTVGPDLTHNGGYDAFVAKITPDGTGFVYAGYIGGSGDDYGFGMAVDASGNAYLTGRTSSTEATFPVTLGPDLTYNGRTDAFVAKVAPDGASLVYAGYLGGAYLDQGIGLAIDPQGNAYVVGHTHSSEATLPVIGGPDLTFNNPGTGHGDAFVCKLLAIPNRPVVKDNFSYCGYIGGASEDAAFWVAVDPFGDAYVVGDTMSAETTFPDGDGFGSVPGGDRTFHGGKDAFITKVVNVPFSGPLKSGDILATYLGADLPLLIRVDPVTGDQAVVVLRGGVNSERPGLAFAPDGKILLARSDLGVPSAVERLDVSSDPPTLGVVSTGGFFSEACDVAIEHSGNILVADADSVDFLGAIIRVDPTTGAQSVVSGGGGFLDPVSMALEPNGSILVADDLAATLFRVDPLLGTQEVVSAGGLFQFPGPGEIALNGDILYVAEGIADESGSILKGAIVSVNPQTGEQQLVSDGGFLNLPDDISVEANGNLLILDELANTPPGIPRGAIIRVDPNTGQQTIVSAGRFLTFREGFSICGRAIAVVP